MNLNGEETSMSNKTKKQNEDDARDAFLIILFGTLVFALGISAVTFLSFLGIHL